MSCDLSEPTIKDAYQEILNREINWLVLGYGDTREKLYLYSKGKGGLEELKKQIVDSIQYALLLYNDHLINIIYVDESLSGVRRARTVVHGRSVAAFFDQMDVSLHVTNVENLTTEAIEQQIKSKGIATEGSQASASPAYGTPKEETNELRSESQIDDKVESEHNAVKDGNDSYPNETILSAGEHEFNQPANEGLLFNPHSAQFNPSPPEFEEESTLPAEPYQKRNLEDEAKRKIQEAWEKRQSVRVQFNNAEDGQEETQMADHITVQGDGSYFWKRRWYVIRGETIYFYRDAMEKYPLSCVDLGSGRIQVEDCSLETLIPNSFRLSLVKENGSDVFLFFSDTKTQMQKAVDALLSHTQRF